MSVLIYIIIFQLFCFVFFVTSLINLIKLIRKKEVIYYIKLKNLFIGLVISFAITYISDTFLQYIDSNYFGLFILFYQLIFNAIISFVPFVIGLIYYSHIKKNLTLVTNITNCNYNKYIYIPVVTCIIIIVFIYVLGFINLNIINNNENIKKQTIKNNVINYLNDKYGKNNYNVIDIKEDIRSPYVFSETLEGYEVYVEVLNSNIKFKVYVDPDDFSIEKDDLVSTVMGPGVHSLEYMCEDVVNTDSLDIYLNRNINSYVVIKKYNYRLDDDIEKKIKEKKYGKIPTKDDLINIYCDGSLKKPIKIDIYDNKNNSVVGDMDKIYKELISNIINYYKNDNSIIIANSTYHDINDIEKQNYFVITNDKIYIKYNSKLHYYYKLEDIIEDTIVLDKKEELY